MLDRKELILEGLAYTVMGIAIVFMILVIIMLVIKAMAFFSKEKKPAQAVEVTKAEVVPEAPVQEQDDEGELVAVIMAAISCMTGQSTSGFVVRSYKKISGGAWNKAGRREVLDNRL